MALVMGSPTHYRLTQSIMRANSTTTATKRMAVRTCGTKDKCVAVATSNSVVDCVHHHVNVGGAARNSTIAGLIEKPRWQFLTVTRLSEGVELLEGVSDRMGGQKSREIHSMLLNLLERELYESSSRWRQRTMILMRRFVCILILPTFMIMTIVGEITPAENAREKLRAMSWYFGYPGGMLFHTAFHGRRTRHKVFNLMAAPSPSVPRLSLWSAKAACRSRLTAPCPERTARSCPRRPRPQCPQRPSHRLVSPPEVLQSGI